MPIRPRHRGWDGVKLGQLAVKTAENWLRRHDLASSIAAGIGPGHIGSGQAAHARARIAALRLTGSGRIAASKAASRAESVAAERPNAYIDPASAPNCPDGPSSAILR